MTNIIKCQTEGCKNPTTRFLFIQDKETLNKTYLCVECWAKAKGITAEEAQEVENIQISDELYEQQDLRMTKDEINKHHEEEFYAGVL